MRNLYKSKLSKSSEPTTYAICPCKGGCFFTCAGMCTGTCSGSCAGQSWKYGKWVWTNIMGRRWSMNYSSKIGLESSNAIQPRFCFACYHNCSLSCNTNCKGGCSAKCNNECSGSCGNNCRSSCISSAKSH